jgi:hypothetical protein
MPTLFSNAVTVSADLENRLVRSNLVGQDSISGLMGTGALLDRAKREFFNQVDKPKYKHHIIRD